jgi:hypothetical protein
MKAIGIPETRILLAERATSTRENVTFSLPVIDGRVGLAKVRSLIAVGKYFTSARYLMTLERHWPAVEKMLATVHDHSHAPEVYRGDPCAARARTGLPGDLFALLERPQNAERHPLRKIPSNIRQRCRGEPVDELCGYGLGASANLIGMRIRPLAVGCPSRP